jgi:hypothetical protein
MSFVCKEELQSSTRNITSIHSVLWDAVTQLSFNEVSLPLLMAILFLHVWEGQSTLGGNSSERRDEVCERFTDSGQLLRATSAVAALPS